MVMCIPASASAEAATVDLEDGEYSIEVILEVEADGRLLHLRQL